jgi:hypothetical protein
VSPVIIGVFAFFLSRLLGVVSCQSLHDVVALSKNTPGQVNMPLRTVQVRPSRVGIPTIQEANLYLVSSHFALREVNSLNQ